MCVSSIANGVSSFCGACKRVFSHRHAQIAPDYDPVTEATAISSRRAIPFIMAPIDPSTVKPLRMSASPGMAMRIMTTRNAFTIDIISNPLHSPFVEEVRRDNPDLFNALVASAEVGDYLECGIRSCSSDDLPYYAKNILAAHFVCQLFMNRRFDEAIWLLPELSDLSLKIFLTTTLIDVATRESLNPSIIHKLHTQKAIFQAKENAFVFTTRAGRVVPPAAEIQHAMEESMNGMLRTLPISVTDVVNNPRLIARLPPAAEVQHEMEESMNGMLRTFPIPVTDVFSDPRSVAQLSPVVETQHETDESITEEEIIAISPALAANPHVVNDPELAAWLAADVT